MHIADPDKCNWIRSRVEQPSWQSYSKDKTMHIYERLCFADTFETFLAGKFNTTKRFGLDGGEAVIPGLKALIDRASQEHGAHSFIIGMPHRGRLNVLANVMRKPMPLLFKEFAGTDKKVKDHLKGEEDWAMSGDVKYVGWRGAKRRVQRGAKRRDVRTPASLCRSEARCYRCRSYS